MRDWVCQKKPSTNNSKLPVVTTILVKKKTIVHEVTFHDSFVLKTESYNFTKTTFWITELPLEKNFNFTSIKH